MTQSQINAMLFMLTASLLGAMQSSAWPEDQSVACIYVLPLILLATMFIRAFYARQTAIHLSHKEHIAFSRAPFGNSLVLLPLLTIISLVC